MQEAVKRIRDELRIELRTALYGARERAGGVTTQSTKLELDGEMRKVTMTVRASEERELENFMLVIFNEQRPADTLEATQEPATRRADKSTAEQLEAQLEHVRKRLQTTIEVYETSREEMNASNEELQSMNEELRSTAEELETSKEELQSVNEELITLNQENRHKVEELSQLTGDLQNLLAATDIATFFLDRDLRIRRVNPKVSELFNVLFSDRVRSLSDLTHKIAYNHLLEDARSVLKTLQPVEHEVKGRGGWYLMRLLPYRTVEDKIDGVVVTFVDITRLKRAEEALQRLLNELAREHTELQTLTETLETRVSASVSEVRKLASQLTLAEGRERNRIAQTLHDELQQQLYAAQFPLSFVRKRLEVGRVESEEERAALSDKLAEAWEMLTGAIGITRGVTSDLSPPVLRGEGLVEALRWLATRLEERFGLRIVLEVDAKLSVPDEAVRALLFSLVHEVLFNVIEHASVERAVVRVRESAGSLTLTVLDEGEGFDPNTLELDNGTGLGLRSAHKRLQLFGGSVGVSSEPGKGTRVTITVPTASLTL